MDTLSIMGWLGVVLFLLTTVNIVCSSVYNVSEGNEKFSFKKFFKGIGKTLLFYGSSVLVSVAFTMLPYINGMITQTFDVVLLSNEILETLSAVGVLGICINAIIQQGKKAYEGLSKVSNIKSDTEVITWDVELDDLRGQE